MATVKFARAQLLRRPNSRDWYLPLVLVVGAAIVVRIPLMTGYPTAMYAIADEVKFARMPGRFTNGSLVSDSWFDSYQHALTLGSLGISLHAMLSFGGLLFGRGTARRVAALLAAGCAALGGLARAIRMTESRGAQGEETWWPAAAR